MKLRRLRSQDPGFDEALDALLQWDVDEDSGVDRVVAAVLRDVKRRGDDAILEYTEQFDRLRANTVAELEIPAEELERALERISERERAALTAAAERIRRYHEHQLEQSWSFEDEHGNVLGQRIAPLERVGVYVPGGQAAYPSSVLMTLIPAKVAGVDDLIVTVPTPDGARSDMVMAALQIAGVDRVFSIGGAQAVGALAYGSETIPRVDKIVGPGGAYVAAAKRQVFGQVGIDIIAGPSEVLIVADGTTDVEWLVLDLFSQAEHDAAAQALLVCPDSDYIEAVAATIDRLLPSMARQETIEASLRSRGALIEAEDLADAITIANRVAPEHLELAVADPDRCIDSVKHAGAIFCGAHAGETLGDYVAGPSHVLPTYGTARFASPLGVYDFQKRSSLIRLTREGASELAAIAVPLANSEGLEAHARAAQARTSG
jgi:histidinol dehydrogenase